MELKTIITCFAGRKEYMELQIKYVVKLLEKYDFIPQISSNTLKVIEHPNNLRLSINFCTWLGTELPLIQDEFSNGIGSDDEWRLCHIIPSKLGKNNLIVKDYKISHFSFGTQNFNKPEILNKYKLICNTII